MNLFFNPFFWSYVGILFFIMVLDHTFFLNKNTNIEKLKAHIIDFIIITIMILFGEFTEFFLHWAIKNLWGK